MDLNNKVAIITGGASGLGEATVRRYHAGGASVAILDMNEEKGQALVSDLGERAIFCNTNVTDEASVQAAITAAVDAFGAIHICNNFAGVATPGKTVSRGEAMPLAAFNTVINVNLIGTFNVMRLAAEQMAKQDPVTDDGCRGVIINTASVAAFEGQIGQVAYSASKGGIVGMTLPAARDLSQLGIRVNAIAPGLIHTPLFDGLPEAAVESLSKSPLFPQRLGQPAEIAHLCQYIVENEYTNGEVIRMDAGIRMQPK